MAASPYEILITGMGRHNAARSIRRALEVVQPALVLTCGFAGGLNPELPLGGVLFDEDYDAGLGNALMGLGCLPGRFYCAKRVAVTSEEKKQLWVTTQADAVEMESSVIRTICAELKISSATIRVISDTANEDLPLDFNAIMTSDDRINYWKLAWAIGTSPRKIPGLIEFQRQTIIAAQKLAHVLDELIKTRLA